MRLLLDLRCLSQPKTGIQIVAANFLRELLDSASGGELQVLAGPDEQLDARLEDRQIIRTPIAPYDFRRQRAVAALMNACDADAVLSPTYFMPFGVRKPYLITVHDLIPRKVWLGAPSLYVRVFLGARMRRAQAVWTVSEYSRAEILRHHPCMRDRVHVVPSGYVAAPGGAGVEKDTRSLLLFASRFRHKNIPFALRAFGALQELSGNAWKLHIVGDASSLRDAPLPEGVCLRGRVTDAELAQMYGTTWGVLLPSAEEGFSLPLLEGMNHGCVVFYHRHTAMRETAGEAGIGLDLGSPEEWARAIHAAGQSAGDAALHRLRALRRSAEFTRERFATALHGALSRSLDGWRGETTATGAPART